MCEDSRRLGRGEALWDSFSSSASLNVFLSVAETKKLKQKRLLLCNSVSLFDTHTHTHPKWWNGFIFILFFFFFFREAEDSLSITVVRCSSVNLFLCPVTFTFLSPRTPYPQWDIPQRINREGKWQRGQQPGRGWAGSQHCLKTANASVCGWDRYGSVQASRTCGPAKEKDLGLCRAERWQRHQTTSFKISLCVTTLGKSLIFSFHFCKTVMMPILVLPL